MIDVEFNFPSPQTVKNKLSRGYRARRNFLVSEMLGMIVNQTPVDTGEARGGWQVAIGEPLFTETGRLDKDGSETVLTGLAALRGASPFSRIYIGNAVPYIGDLDEGYSSQAPLGILKVVVPAFRNIYKDAL
jgi:hypothetical protein